MSSPTVWVVDDDRSIRWVLEKALQGAGLNTRFLIQLKQFVKHWKYIRQRLL